MSDEQAVVPPVGSSRLLKAACICALAGLGFTLLHLAWSSPLLFTLFMIVGQPALGAAILLYIIAVLRDLRRSKVL